jgi:hypothetical protein
MRLRNDRESDEIHTVPDDIQEVVVIHVESAPLSSHCLPCDEVDEMEQAGKEVKYEIPVVDKVAIEGREKRTIIQVFITLTKSCFCSLS